MHAFTSVQAPRALGPMQRYQPMQRELTRHSDEQQLHNCRLYPYARLDNLLVAQQQLILTEQKQH